MKTTPHTAYNVTLLAPATPTDPEGIRRLRRWLKGSWRQYALRCVAIGLAVTDKPQGAILPRSEASDVSVVPEDSDAAESIVERY